MAGDQELNIKCASPWNPEGSGLLAARIILREWAHRGGAAVEWVTHEQYSGDEGPCGAGHYYRDEDEAFEDFVARSTELKARRRTN